MFNSHTYFQPISPFQDILLMLNGKFIKKNQNQVKVCTFELAARYFGG